MSASTGAVASEPTSLPARKGHALRALVSPEPPGSSTVVGVAFAVGDYLLFYAGAAVAILAPWWVVKALGSEFWER